MKFSTKSTYGLRAIARLAKTHGKGNVSLSSIAEEEKISLAYLERIFVNLKRAGIVKAAKGAAGGYRLAKKPRDLSALEVIRSLEGENSLFHCLGKSGKVFCSLRCDCAANQALIKVESALNKTLENIKLSQLVKS